MESDTANVAFIQAISTQIQATHNCRSRNDEGAKNSLRWEIIFMIIGL